MKAKCNTAKAANKIYFPVRNAELNLSALKDIQERKYTALGYSHPEFKKEYELYLEYAFILEMIEMYHAGELVNSNTGIAL
jgi:hypothetical protein